MRCNVIQWKPRDRMFQNNTLFSPTNLNIIEKFNKIKIKIHTCLVSGKAAVVWEVDCPWDVDSGCCRKLDKLEGKVKSWCNEYFENTANSSMKFRWMLLLFSLLCCLLLKWELPVQIWLLITMMLKNLKNFVLFVTVKDSYMLGTWPSTMKDL